MLNLEATLGHTETYSILTQDTFCQLSAYGNVLGIIEYFKVIGL